MSEQSAGQEKETKQRFAKKEYDLDTGVFSIAFGDGETIELNVDELPEQMKRQAMFHGIGQKSGDSYAGAKGDYAKAKEAARGIFEQLQKGEWRQSAGEGEAKPRIGELAQAIANVKGIELARATAAVEAATDEKRKEWRGHPKVKAAIAQIRAQKAQEELAKAQAAAQAAGEAEAELDVA